MCLATLGERIARGRGGLYMLSSAANEKVLKLSGFVLKSLGLIIACA